MPAEYFLIHGMIDGHLNHLKAPEGGQNCQKGQAGLDILSADKLGQLR